MPDNELLRLRELRRRAEALLSSLVSDLQPFRHTKEENGFVRKPDSDSADDVNVTTTCSCIMALAFADKLGEMYSDGSKKIPNKIFANVVAAPWMSSGLAEHNPFTTTLVLRTFGFLAESALPGLPKPNSIKRTWESHFQFLSDKAVEDFAKRLQKGKDALSKLLFTLLTRKTQDFISGFVANPVRHATLAALLSAELERIIGSTALYTSLPSKRVQLSNESKQFIGTQVDGYNIARFNRLLLHDYYHDLLKPLAELSLDKIAAAMSTRICRFKINNYPPAAAVVFWFIDGISRAKICLPPENWTELCKWVTEEFARQRSLVVAEHAAMMDPVAMAMAACACSRLRFISNKSILGTNSNHLASLPSVVELEQAVRELFAKQTMSGIWPKYFPLFHYQEAGSNFCFTFEMLEALLAEFGGSRSHLINEDLFIVGLERAVKWCEENRLRCSGKKHDITIQFNGWNSGGFLDTLKKSQPESWATAVVHMFLRELVDVLSRHIQKKLLQQYEASLPHAKSKKVKDLIDIELWLEGKHQSLKAKLSRTMVRSFNGMTASTLRRKPQKKVPLSALLFGPPGTSKTEVTKAVAAELGWPLLEIDPSHFLKSSLQDIYVQAETIFEDVMDLSGVVVLFDEMDALVQKRDAEGGIDTESKFLTTYMLPKLAKLHDRGRVVFFMATNFQANFDDAIKRAGRFDFLLCMGPPTLEAKCNALHAFFGTEEVVTEEIIKAGKRIMALAKQDNDLQQQLELYTFGEFKSFVTEIGDSTSINAKLQKMQLVEFTKLVREDSKSVGLKFMDLAKTLRLMQCKSVSELDKKDFDEKKLKKHRIDVTNPAVKYVLDRKQSRRQCARLKDEDKAAQTVHHPLPTAAPPATPSLK